MKKFLHISTLILLVFIYGFLSGDKNNRVNKTTTNDHYNYIAVNQCMMWVSNNGDGSHDPRNDGNGFYWPGGENATKSAIFEDGLIWGGIVDTQIRVNGNTHRQGLQAGKILDDGIPDDPSLEKYRVYKIYKYWQQLPPGLKRDQYEKDYNEWPVEDGAPWIDINGDGVFTRGVDEPQFIGDETLWYVSNDMDTATTRFTYGSDPIGLEIQTTVFGFQREDLKDVVFKKYKIINKSNTTIKDMYFTYWADGDLGDANDDYEGFDSTLNMSYVYNADNFDGDGSGNTYGTPPPAVAHMIVQGPIVPASQTDSARYGDKWIKGFKNLQMTSSGMMFKHAPGGDYPTEPRAGVYEGTIEWYNDMQGLNWNGNPIINPLTGEPTIWPLNGDPVTGTGWYLGDGWPGGPTPGDRRYHVPTGPFNMEPADTQEIAIGILISRGESNIQSVAELKKDAANLQLFYDNYKPKVPDPIIEFPKYYSLEQNYPNPFNPITTIIYQIPKLSFVTLKVYDVLGNVVETLVKEEKPAGRYEVEFSTIGGPESSIRYPASGVYFYQLRAGDFIQSKKMMLLK